MTTRNTTYCPGARLDGQPYCYCNSVLQYKYPDFCDVTCEDLNPEDRWNGCVCPGYLSGPRCDRMLCHYTPSKFYKPEFYQLFCIDGYDFYGNNTDHRRVRVDENCTHIANRGERSTTFFPLCPCLNNGYRLDDHKTGNVSCQCTRGYTGSLCQIEPAFNRPSPLPTIGVIAFLAAVFVVIGLALWYRKKQTMKAYAKMYQLDEVVDNSKANTKRVVMFAPLKLPTRPAPDAATTTPGGKTRRGTLSVLFHGRHTNQPEDQPRRQRGSGGKKKGKGQKNVPTVFEGQEEQGSSQQQAAPAYDDSFQQAPQYLSSGTGMG